MEQLEALREFVAQATRALGGNDEAVSAFRLAVDEAATNVFEHAYGGRPGQVDVEVTRDHQSIVVSLRHWGAAFDPDAVPQPDPSLPLAQRSPGGWGLFLMRQMMDDVVFHFDPLEGHQVILSRQLRHDGTPEGGQP